MHHHLKLYIGIAVIIIVVAAGVYFFMQRSKTGKS
jgi:branched-subunit amino acid ABC-type transport system permease component